MIKEFGSLKKIKISVIAAFMAVALCVVVGGCAPSSYNPEKKDPQLKTPDILENGKLKVGVDFGNPPFAGETSKAAGIDIDTASAIAEDLGLEVDFVDVGTSPGLALSNKKCDVVMGVSKAVSVQDMWRSDVYIKTACALFAKDAKASMPASGGADTFATEMASQSAIACQAQFSAANIKLCGTISEAFEKMNKGEVKYVAADAVIGSYTANNVDGDANLICLISKPSGYCIGAAKGKTNLCEKIKASLENLSKGGVLDVIENRWLGKSLNIDSIQQTPGAANQADAGELEAGVYSQTHPNNNTP